MKTNETIRYYEKHADLWTARKTHSFHHEKQFRQFVSLLPKRASVIDIGCAAGIHVPLFLGIGRFLRYHGIDVSKKFLSTATQRYPQLTFTHADITDRKSLPRKKFDGFFAAAVLMHTPLQDWPCMFENIASITKPGAIGYITLPIEHPSGENATTDPRHFTLLTPREQQKHITEHGWTILHKGTLDGFTKKGVWRWYIVQRS